MSAIPKLVLKSIKTATSYSFRVEEEGSFGWALCTVNDQTGELLITSDWGNWSHRWSPRPESLGAPTLTAFIGARGEVDYIARKLLREGRDCRRFSASKTVAEFRKMLCLRRAADGREQLERRIDADDFRVGGAYTDDGLPIYSRRKSSEYESGNPFADALPYLSRDTARRLWDDLCELDDDATTTDAFYERIMHIDGFEDYITVEPWQHSQYVQTHEDRALRDIILPALIEVCALAAAGRAV